MMEINVIIRVHDREDYIPHLFKVMETWQSVLKINAIVCYSGNNEELQLEHDYVPAIPTDPWPRSYSLNDWVKIYHGYWRIKITECPRFLCLCADSWLCDPSVILKVFERMEQLKCGYGGNWWNNGFENPGVSSDIFFADTRFGNVFENLNTFDASAKPGEPGQCLECWIKHHCNANGIGIYIIHKREPVHPNNRFACEALRWTMEHDLSKNLANSRRWGILA